MKKIFIAAPYTHNLDTDLLNTLEKILKKMKFEVIIPHRYVIDVGDRVKKAIEDNYKRLADSDIVLADVSEPSHGVGMEIMYAYQCRKEMIFIKKRGSKASKMVLIYTNRVVEYEDNADLAEKLAIILGE